MREAIFPVLGPLLVVALALPSSALLAKGLLLALSRLETGAAARRRTTLRYAVLVASSAVPLAWFISAALHQAESGERLLICAVRGASGGFNLEAIGFAGVLSALAVGLALPSLSRSGSRPRAYAAGEGAAHERQRIDALVAGHPALHGLRGLVAVEDDCAAPIATAGVLVPRVFLRTEFARRLDDVALCAALHHELEHLKGRDPLRYLAARWALAVNPLGRVILGDELARWVLSRELQCDREAVLHGASAPALAQALVAAARPPSSAPRPTLGDSHTDVIRLRVGLLLSYADRRPKTDEPPPSLRPSLVFLAGVLALPHHAGTQPLDTLHQASERAVALLAGN